MKKQTITILAGALALALTCSVARGDTKTWSGGTGDWFIDGNWSPSGVPQAGDDVVISTAGAVVSLTNTVPASGSLNSFAISGTATLNFSNWSTELRATATTVGNQAILTCAGPFTEAQMSNRVSIVCSNLTVIQGGKINVDGKGYAAGNGPGKGLASLQGGGYGGQGQTTTGTPGGAPYGAAENPLAPGSGGFTTGGGAGGGAVRIEAQGSVVVNGTLSTPAVSAKGVSNVDAPGSGGSIQITCNTLTGINGVISADAGGPEHSSGKGGGGGGRIALHYDTDAQALLPVPSLTFSALPGKRVSANVQHRFRGDLGTLYLADTYWLGTTIPHSGRLVIPGFTSWTSPNLTVKGWVRFPAESFTLTVPGNVVSDGAHARLDIGTEQWTDRATFNHHCNPTVGPTLTVGGNLSLINGGHFSIHAGATNGAAADYGARVDIAGTLTINAYSWAIPVSHPTDGGSVRFRVGNLTISKGAATVVDAGIDANGVGWAGVINGTGYGFGAAATKTHGSGHGGLGRQPYSATATGAMYGAPQKPLLPGSGGSGGALKGGNGGGVVWVEAEDTITLNGTIKANAKADGMLGGLVPHVEDTYGRMGDNSAGGSGGGIYLLCKRIAGAGALSAKGAIASASSSGPGGGGRIAVRYRSDLTGGAVTFDVAGGTNPQPHPVAGSGTVVWSELPAPGTTIQVR